MIIDMRLRPPYKSIMKMNFFETPQFIAPLVEKNGGHMPLSCFEKSMDMLIQEMDEAGIDMGVVPIRTSQGVRNEDLLDLLQEYPDRFIGMAGVDPTEGLLKALDTIDEYVLNGPCKGIVMELPFCTGGPVHVDDPMLTVIYEKCERDRVPVYLQWGGLFAPDLGLYDPIELDHVAAKYPKMTIICGHAGWPYVTQMCQICICRQNVYLAPDTYMTPNTPGYEDYVIAAKNMLSDRICFSTAYPLATIAETKKSFDELPVSDEIKDNIFCNNAKRALNLE